MRQREQHDLSDEARRELDALDRALAGEPVDAELDAVAKLARDMRAMRPEPSGEFATRLDDRVEDGFPPEPGSAASPAARLREWLAGVRPARIVAPAGAMATLVIVVSVAVIQSGGGDATTPVEETRGGAPAAPAIPEDAAGGAVGEAAPGIAVPGDQEQFAVPAPSGDRVAPNEDRKVERSASLALSTDGDGFADVTDGVVAVTDRYDGFVLSSEQSSSGDSSRAEFDLRIPSGDLSAALADLSELAHVESRTEDALDITAPAANARQQLTDARAQVEGLLTQLAEADSPKETDRIQARLDIARSDVAAAKAEVRGLARRANFSDVRVTVTSDGGGDGDWGVEEAIDDIGDGLSTAGGVALVAAAIVLPIGLVIALIAFVWRRTVRRGRERALGE
ncbi:MAG TPA: DUF4349 domain-containing protein [Solirubrobacterales bacterium]